MEDIVTLIVKTYGIVGLLIAAPFVAAWHFWKDIQRTRDEYTKAIAVLNEKHAKELSELNDRYAKSLTESNEKIVKAQEQRVIDAHTVSGKLIDMVAEQAAMNRETNVVLDKVGEFLTTQHTKLLTGG